MRRTATMVGVTAAVLVAALVAGGSGGTSGGPPTAADPVTGDPVALPEDLELAGALTAFDSCDDYLAHVQERALEQVGPYGLHGGWWGDETFAMESMDDGMTADSAAGGDEAGRADAPVANDAVGPGETGTNVQEAGVDEPDRVKTDGRWLYAVRGEHIHVVDLARRDLEVVARVPNADGWGSQLLLADDRLLVAAPATDHHLRALPDVGGDAILPGPGWGWSGTTLRVYDVSDPTDPTLRETLTLDGSVLSSRLIDGTVRLVVRAEPTGLDFEAPVGGGLRAERDATERNREVIRRSSADQWIPFFVHETAGGRVEEGTLVPCERIARPDEFAGLSTVTVLTLDLQGVLRPQDGATAVLGGGETVYASRDRLYVSTTRWQEPTLDGTWRGGSTASPAPDITIEPRTPVEDDGTRTELHAFDLTDPRRAPHVASGAVPGRLLSQWAMSEHEGVLRVATTTGDPWNEIRPSQSHVTTLEERDGRLAELGRVDGLGVTETIHAVRFIGEVGYVVTFREVDPLYTIDLSDPSDPREIGELKIPGFSNYLHPIGDGLLLGVGQDADEDTGMLEGGQVSLFDVSDLADPRRLDTLELGEGWSPVQDDHRAFLHWPATGLSVVSFQSWGHTAEDAAERNGAVAFTADREEGLQLERRLTHTPLALGEDGVAGASEQRLWDVSYQATVDRSLVVGDRLLTLSEAGVASHDLETLADTGWTPWR